jgi:hypothetical protein
MKWFQQNRALGTLLIVFATCALLAAILLFWAGSKWAAARREFDAAAAERTRLQRLDPFPSAANYEKLKVLLGNYIAALDKFKEELKKEVAPAPPLAPNEFQSHLRQAVIATLNRARTNKVKLPDKFQLGFDEFTTALPKTAVAPLLGQELSQMQMLIGILLDAKVDSVTSLHRAALREERERLPTPSPKPAAVPARRGGSTGGQKSVEPSATNLVERNIVDITFKAAPAVARKVLNEIVSSNEQFFIIRTLYVHNENDKGPPRARTAETNPPATETPGATQPGNAPLHFIVGNEHIEISARIEMVRFMF